MKKTPAIIGALIVLLTTSLAAQENNAKPSGAAEIHAAAASGDLNKVRALIEADPALLESKDDRGNTPLISACWGGDANNRQRTDAVANYLIDKGANINARNESGATPLYFATKSFDLTRRLIAMKAEVNVRAYVDYTPLHEAAFSGNLKVAKLLIDHGADLNFHGAIGTVLQKVIYNKTESGTEMAKLLLESGAKLQEFSFGNTELHLAVLRDYAEIIPILVKHGADVNAVNEYGHTPLYYAAMHGHRKAAEALIAAGANKSSIVESNYGKAPQLSATLKEGEAYIWYLGGVSPCDGYAVKTKDHLLIFNPPGISDSPEAGLANGYLNPNELAGLKITVLIDHRYVDVEHSPSISELAKAMPSANFVLNFKPAAGNSGDSNIPPYRLAAPNESFSMDGIKVHTIPAMLHTFFESEGLGYLIEADGVKIFHAGLHVSNNDTSNVEKYRKEIDFLKPFGPIDIAILPISGRHITLAYEPYLYLLDQLSPKAVYLIGDDLTKEEFRKCIEILRARNVPVAYPEGGIAVGERFHYLRDRASATPLLGTADSTLDYLGQTPPGDEPQVFAKGSVSVDGKNTHALQFSPDGSFLVFSRYPDRTSFRMVRSQTGWSQPEQTSFRGKEVSFDPLLKRLFYDDQGDIYFVGYGPDGFSKPTRLPPSIDTEKMEYYPSITAHRNLYFSRDGKWETARVQVAKLQGDGFDDPVDLGEPINVGGASHEFVAPDESYMLFNSPRAGSYTQNDIWVSFRNRDGLWAKPVNLGERINRDATAVLCPTVSPDGKYLFFTRLHEESNTGYVYWVSTKIIEDLRPKSNALEVNK